MTESHAEKNVPFRLSAAAKDKAPAGALPLAEDMRRAAVPVDQFGSWRLFGLSFAALIVLPVLCAAAYYGLFAADQYAAEFRFSVRSQQESGTDQNAAAQLAQMGKSVPSEAGRLPYMVAGYLRSRNAARELDRGGWLRALFSRDAADWLSRFGTRKSSDELWRYWQHMIRVNVDRVSGLVLVRVLAFTPEDALALAQAVSACAEKMIAAIGVEERANQLQEAERELHRASLRYSEALGALRDVRNEEKMVDPQQTIGSAADILLGVTRARLSLERERDANLNVLSAGSPQQKVLSDQIRALESEEASLARALTSARQNAKTAAQSIARFETRELEVRFSQRLLEIAQSADARARQETERRHIYFAPFVDPKKPGIAEFPLRARSVAFVGICAFGVWSVAMLAWAGIRDRRFER